MLQKLGFQPKSKSPVKIDLLPALLAVQEQKTASLRSAGNRVGVGEEEEEKYFVL